MSTVEIRISLDEHDSLADVLSRILAITARESRPPEDRTLAARPVKEEKPTPSTAPSEEPSTIPAAAQKGKRGRGRPRKDESAAVAPPELPSPPPPPPVEEPPVEEPPVEEPPVEEAAPTTDPEARERMWSLARELAGRSPVDAQTVRDMLRTIGVSRLSAVPEGSLARLTRGFEALLQASSDPYEVNELFRVFVSNKELA